jgi:hypothetical protein
VAVNTHRQQVAVVVEVEYSHKDLSGSRALLVHQGKEALVGLQAL